MSGSNHYLYIAIGNYTYLKYCISACPNILGILSPYESGFCAKWFHGDTYVIRFAKKGLIHTVSSLTFHGHSTDTTID